MSSPTASKGKAWVFRGYRVLPICPWCGEAISSPSSQPPHAPAVSRALSPSFCRLCGAEVRAIESIGWRGVVAVLLAFTAFWFGLEYVGESRLLKAALFGATFLVVLVVAVLGRRVVLVRPPPEGAI